MRLPDVVADRRLRHARVRAILDRLDLSAVVLRRSANFAWYTGGADNRVNHSSPFGVADLVLTRAHEYVLASTIEAPRIRAEEAGEIEIVEFPWYEPVTPALRRLTGDGPIGADFPLDDALDVAAEIDPLRCVLDDSAVAQYQLVGNETMRAVAEALATFGPGISEDEAVAAIQAACRRRGLAMPVALAAADDRIARFRHPIARGTIAHHRLMAVVCAERFGLYANLTRIVEFTPPDAALVWRQEACETILRRMREEATIPGRTLAEAFADCRRYYAEAGFPDEWQLHHQGGLSGYASREVIATPHTLQVMQVGQAFAWNPSITGAKAEETFILTENGPLVVAR